MTGAILDYPADTGCYLSTRCSTCPFDICLIEEVQPRHRKEYIKNTVIPELAPDPAPKPTNELTPTWQRPSWWNEYYRVPTTCPRCRQRLIRDGEAPFEIYCLSCGTQILKHIPVPEGWKSYSKPSV